MNKNKSILLISLIAILLCFTACSSADTDKFDPSSYIKSVDSKIVDLDGHDEVVVTVVISNKWKELTSVSELNQLRTEANSRGLEEVDKYGDKVYAATFNCIDEDGNGFDLELKELADTFLSTLKSQEFLLKEITDALPDTPQKDRDEDGITTYIWSAYDENANRPEEALIQKIELSVENGEMLRYHYKNYFFLPELPDTPMTEDEASKLVCRFADTFIPNGGTLTFTNDPEWQVQSLYDPGHVETWSVTSDDITYDIVVDLDMGSVIYFTKSYQ